MHDVEGDRERVVYDYVDINLSAGMASLAEFRSNPQLQGKGESEVSHHARINCG